MKLKAPFVRYQSGDQTLETFDAMCKAHDLTFAFSDNHVTWQNGHEELKLISEAAIKLGPETAAIWNKNVRKKIAPPAVEDYIW